MGSTLLYRRRMLLANKKINLSTVLFADGTLIINERSVDRSANIALHGAVTKEVAPCGDNEDYDLYTLIPLGERGSIYHVEFGAPTAPKSCTKWFVAADELTTIDFTNFDASNCVNMDSMFENCKKLAQVDVSGWNTSKLTSILSIFSCCWSLRSIVGISDWDVSRVANMGSAFYELGGRTETTEKFSIDLSGWNTANVLGMSSMFDTCRNLASIGDTSGWDLSKVTNAYAMFKNCNALTTLDVSNWGMGSCTNFAEMFRSCNNLTALDVSNWDTSKATTFTSLFYDCPKVAELDVSNWNTGNVTNFSSMFYNCRLVPELDVSGWNTAKATHLGSMFYNCYNITSIDVSGWDTSNVIRVDSMFKGARSLTSIDLSNFNTSKISNYVNLFEGCTALTSITMPAIRYTGTSGVSMVMMFAKVAATELDVSGWDTSSVTNMNYMFGNCPNLTTIYADTFVTSAVTMGRDTMFAQCLNLVGGAGTAYDNAHAGVEYARIDNPPTYPGYFTQA